LTEQRIRQAANVIATLVENTPGAMRMGYGIEIEITEPGRELMAETLAAWLEDEGLSKRNQ
jgi:hypothetical protein